MIVGFVVPSRQGGGPDNKVSDTGSRPVRHGSN